MNKRKLLPPLLILFILIGFGIDYLGTRLIVQVKGGINKRVHSNGIDAGSLNDYNFKHEELTIVSHDNLKLKAILVKSNTNEQKGTIILLHGIRNRKEHFLRLCQQLADSSYNSVCLDLRGHGQSEGNYCTYGYYEKSDVATLVDSLLNKPNLSKNIGVWGQSLGGAVALQALSICPKIQFGLVESTFSEFNVIVNDYFKQIVGFKMPLLTNYLIWRAGHVANFKPDDVKPYLYAKEITQPMLMAHGISDHKINIAYGYRIYKNLASQNKEFLDIPNAGHLNVWSIGGDSYFNKVFNFLNQQQ